MIRSFRHRGLKRLYEDDDRRRLPADKVERIRQVLAQLDAANAIEDLDIASFRLHPLKGDLRGFWAVTVRANWRIIFRLVKGEILDVDLIDYH